MIFVDNVLKFTCKILELIMFNGEITYLLCQVELILDS